MQNNNSIDYFKEDEIDLKEIFKLLINSKKLIIVTTLVITTLGTIYAYQQAPRYHSTALIEIGNYQPEEYNQMLIEPAEDLIEELMIKYTHKQQVNVSFNFLNEVDRLIEIAASSDLSVNNEKFTQ